MKLTLLTLLIISGIGIITMIYLLTRYAFKSNYYFWAGRCEKCKYFDSEVENAKEIFCLEHGWRSINEMEQCGDYNLR